MASRSVYSQRLSNLGHTGSLSVSVSAKKVEERKRQRHWSKDNTELLVGQRL